MSDELSAPLGRKRRNEAPGRSRRGLPLARIGLSVLALLVAGTIGWIIAIDDPTGGLPQAEVQVSQPQPNALAESLVVGPETPAPPMATPPIPATDGGPSIITLGPDVPAGGTDAPLLTEGERAAVDFGAEPDLVEVTQHGMIPRVSATGVRPFDAYARPSITPAAATGRGLVSIVVTGLGLNQTTTDDAIDSLPGAVTLSFVPYGNSLVQSAVRARESGHEILLEVPLEPFDYPQSDPGPHTLLVEQPPRDNLEKLYWLMARFGGYTGIVNHLGARFTASAADFAPIVEELGLRGIGYLDDGSSNRSVAPQLTRENSVPYMRADAVLDNNPSRAAILAQLDALAATAADRGYAVGILSALPVSIATLAEWSQALDENATVLVPFSALARTGATQ